MSKYTPKPAPIKFNLLIIDPQVDFHEDGALGISGATQDSDNIIEFINSNTDKINKIFVSLDTHTSNHISHADYWKCIEDGSKPSPYTTFTLKTESGEEIKPNSSLQEINAGKIVDDDGKTYEPVNSALLSWTKYYVCNVKGKKDGVGYTAIVWPTHCLQGTPGHQIYAPLKACLDKVAGKVADKVEYHIKGQNCLTEMYSIMKAEITVENELSDVKPAEDLWYTPKAGVAGESVPHTTNVGELDIFVIGDTQTSVDKMNMDSDTGRVIPTHVNLKTTFNNELFNTLTDGVNDIVICGEALSHCVRFSGSDIMDNLKDGYTLHLLDNASTSVDGFYEQGEAFKKSIRSGKYNVKGNLLNTGAFLPTSSPREGSIGNGSMGGKRTRRTSTRKLKRSNKKTRRNNKKNKRTTRK